MDWSTLHQKVSAVNWLLSPLSALYGLGWAGYEGIYRLGIKRSTEAHHPVIVVGNLRVGGTGKTPITMAIARLLLEMDYEIVISANGYGSPARYRNALAPPGELLASEWGDEPAEMRDALPNVPLIVGRDRLRAAQICAESFPKAVLIMDDGFQHLPVKKHVSLLVDEPNPQNKFLLPAGPYRQPRSARKRADLILPEGAPIAMDRWLECPDRLAEGIAEGSKVQVLTAIANPDRLLSSIREMGFSIEHVVSLPDHAKIQEVELAGQVAAHLPLLMSGKDWVKWRERTDRQDYSVWVLRQKVRFLDESAMKRFLEKKLNESKTQSR